MPLKLTTYRNGRDLPRLPGADTFHSNELFQVYEATPGHTPLLVVASEGGRVVGKLLAVVRKDKRCELFGTGEYFNLQPRDQERIFAEMLQRLTQEALQQSYLIVFRNLEKSMFGYKAFKENNYFGMGWIRVHNSLHSVTNVKERFVASRLRQIKKGVANGAIVKEADTEQEIQAFAKMLKRNYSSKLRRHFPGLSFFHHFHQLLGRQQGRLFVVTYKGKVIGGSVCLYSGGNAYLWFSGGMRKSYALQHPGILAVWKAMDDAHQRGYAHFEFMDVGMPYHYHGYHEFVMRFGGKEISTRRWFRIKWNWLNRILKWVCK